MLMQLNVSIHASELYVGVGEIHKQLPHSRGIPRLSLTWQIDRDYGQECTMMGRLRRMKWLEE
jgi:hypothetical protein